VPYGSCGTGGLICGASFRDGSVGRYVQPAVRLTARITRAMRAATVMLRLTRPALRRCVTS